MSRPSANTDKRLVEAALGMLQQSGLSGLKLRDVARKSGVNLGMFHYHFKTKEHFTRAVLQEAYDRFFHEFSLETSKEGIARERLRGALLTLGKFIMGNRRIILSLIHDAINKDRVVLDFVKTNFPRHGRVILDLVGQSKKEGALRKLSLPNLMPMLMGSIVIPPMALAVLEHLDVKNIRFIPLSLIKRELASEKALMARVDLALEALAPRK